MKWFTDTGRHIWQNKYRADFKETMSLMVSEVFSVLKNADSLARELGTGPLPQRMLNIFLEGRGLPGGRILFYFASKALGENRKLTPMNCFVIPIKDDSMEAIFEYKKEMALTFKAGGGVGTNLSGLRPKGSPVNNAAISSTGPVSFLPSISKDAEVVGQNFRRGALMKSMSIWHPDSMDLVKVKTEGDMAFMNISLMIDDKFMELPMDAEIDFWYPAPITYTPQLFKEVDYIANCYNHSDDYFKVASENFYRQREIYKTATKKEIWSQISNCAWKCGDPGILFWDTIRKDWKQSEELYSTNPCGEEPLPAYGACNLGAINFASYTSDDLSEFSLDCKAYTIFLDSLITYCLENNAYPLKAQADSAAKFRQIGLGPTGIADLFILKGAIYGDPLSQSLLEARMQAKQKAEIETSQALSNSSIPRNAQISTVAPTGSISMVLGCSSGIEPNFSFAQQKLVNGEYLDVNMPIVQRAPSKRVLVAAHDISWQNRIAIQAIAQKYTDGSISSTLNLPSSSTPHQIEEIYEAAWKAGLKGVTVYRYGSKDVNAIQKKDDKKERGILDGKTVKVPLDTSWYITVNFKDSLPIEVFINAGKSGSDTKAWTEALGRLSSLYLQSGGKAEKLISALQDIKGKKTIFKNGWSIQSGPDAIAQALSAILSVESLLECPECSKLTFHFAEGCGVCESCGYEKC
jgi:ribonucleoside-diphosphate reductase alpha chain